MSADGQQEIVEMKIDDLPSEFLLTELQIELLTTLPQYIVQSHIQVVDHNGTFYHLNPDLVFGVNQIVLCHVCAENPMSKDQEQIKNGHFVVCIRVLGQRNHLFCKTITQMRHFRVQPLQCGV